MESNNSSETPLRCGLYCRTSTTGQSPQLQLDGLRALAKQRGWVVQGEYIDVGWSGSKSKRPQLDALLQEVHRGAISIVSVWKLDRLARSTRDLLTLADDLRVRGVQLVSVMETIDTTTAAGRAFFSLIAIFSELEKDFLRERVTAALAVARRRGVHIGRPFVRVDIARALALRKEGKSLRAIARELKIGVATLHRALQSLSQPVVPQTSIDDATQSISATKAA